jgi:cation transporter-like permease
MGAARRVSLLALAAASASAFSAGAVGGRGWLPRWQVAGTAHPLPARRLRRHFGARGVRAQAQDGARSTTRPDPEDVPLVLPRLPDAGSPNSAAPNGRPPTPEEVAQEPADSSVNMIVKIKGDPGDILQKLQQAGLMESAVRDTIILHSDKARLQKGTVTIEGRKRVKERSYFGTPLTQLILRRSSVLTVLMFMQSLSSLVLSQYEELIAQNVFLALFLTMLTGTGGNAGNQSSSMVIRGMSTGEINNSNMGTVIFRELLASSAIGLLLAAAAFFRVAMTPGADTTGATGILLFVGVHAARDLPSRRVTLLSSACPPLCLHRMTREDARRACLRVCVRAYVHTVVSLATFITVVLAISGGTARAHTPYP